MSKLFYGDIGCEPSLDPSEPEYLAYCDDCGAGMMDGDNLFQGEHGNWLCAECFMDEIKDFNPINLAFSMGREVCNVGERD